MATCWRISNHIDLSGKGGVIAPGRWNSIGRPIVYLAESPSGAMLEHLVHLANSDGKLPQTYGLLEIGLAGNLRVEELNPPQVSDWRDLPELSQRIGDLWLGSLSSPLARVPSAVMPSTWNILLNSVHPDAARIEIVAASRELYDTRLFRFGKR